MKSQLIIAGAVVVLLSAGPVFADDGMGHDGMMEEKGSMMEGMGHGGMMEEKGSMMEDADHMGSKLPNVGNKICPISGEKVGEMGKSIQVEHEGKIYNLCCPLCLKDFKKDPAKYIQKINAELENPGDAAGEDMDHDASSD